MTDIIRFSNNDLNDPKDSTDDRKKIEIVSTIEKIEVTSIEELKKRIVSNNLAIASLQSENESLTQKINRLITELNINIDLV